MKRRLVGRHTSDQLGASCYEAAIVLPILLILLGIAVDFGRWFEGYMYVSRTAYEASRFGASLPGLEVCEGTANSECGVKPNHKKLYDRWLALFQDSGYRVDAANFYSQRTSEDETVANPNTVVVRVSVSFDYLFPMIGKVLVPEKIMVVAESPYLYRTS